MRAMCSCTCANLNVLIFTLHVYNALAYSTLSNLKISKIQNKH